MTAPGARRHAALPIPCFDVAIIGAGPTGLALAHDLGRRGLTVRLVDRNVGVMPIPRAVHIDGETMRVFDDLGVADALLKIMRSGGFMRWVNAAGETLLTREGVQGLGVHGWHNDYYFHQPDLEAVLRRELAAYPQVSVAEGLELRDLVVATGEATEADPAASDYPVTLHLHDLTMDSQLSWRARYVVGCDGARSTVRRFIGGDDYDDLGEHQAWLVVDGVLRRPLDLPEHSVQHCDPARPATSIYVHALRRRWELMLLPGEDPKAMTEPQRVWQMLSRWVQPGQAVLERAATYVFHSLVARQWQTDRLMIAGDAAHQTPPFLGQGLCAGIRDVANLGWKLARAVQAGSAPESSALLATYGTERRPHAYEFVRLAVEVGKVIQVTDPQQAALRDQQLSQQGLRFSFPAPCLGPGVHSAAHPGFVPQPPVEMPDATQPPLLLGPAIAAAAGADDPVGRIAPQSQLDDGRWTDELARDAAGCSVWSVWVNPSQGLDASDPLSADLRARLQSLGVCVIDAPGVRAQAWLDQHRLTAVLIRPDRYLAAALGDGERPEGARDETAADWLRLLAMF